MRASASAWFRLRRRSARSRVRSALHALDLRPKRIARSLATRSSMRATTWPAATRIPSQRRHLHHPAIGAAGDGDDVGGHPRIVFVDVGEAADRARGRHRRRAAAARRQWRGNAGGTAGGRGRATRTGAARRQRRWRLRQREVAESRLDGPRNGRGDRLIHRCYRAAEQRQLVIEKA